MTPQSEISSPQFQPAWQRDPARSPAAAERLLQERARLLAQEPPAPTSGEVLMVVEFTLGTEHYGIDSTLVREVYPLKEYTPLPGTPDFIMGIMNVRGQILSITDLCTLFALPLPGLRTANRVIILSHPGGCHRRDPLHLIVLIT